MIVVNVAWGVSAPGSAMKSVGTEADPSTSGFGTHRSSKREPNPLGDGGRRTGWRQDEGPGVRPMEGQAGSPTGPSALHKPGANVRLRAGWWRCRRRPFSPCAITSDLSGPATSCPTVAGGSNPAVSPGSTRDLPPRGTDRAEPLVRIAAISEICPDAVVTGWLAAEAHGHGARHASTTTNSHAALAVSSGPE